MKKVSFSKDTRHLNRNVICQRYGKKKKKILNGLDTAEDSISAKKQINKKFLTRHKEEKKEVKIGVEKNRISKI